MKHVLAACLRVLAVAAVAAILCALYKLILVLGIVWAYMSGRASI